MAPSVSLVARVIEMLMKIICLLWGRYLCTLRWMEACLEEDLPPTTELEEGLRNGVYLGKLSNFFAPKMVSVKKIYDRDQARYKVHCHCIAFKLLPFLGKVIVSLHLHFSPAYIIADRKTFHIFQALPDSLKQFHTGKGEMWLPHCNMQLLCWYSKLQKCLSKIFSLIFISLWHILNKPYQTIRCHNKFRPEAQVLLMF